MILCHRSVTLAAVRNKGGLRMQPVGCFDVFKEESIIFIIPGKRIKTDQIVNLPDREENSG